MNSVFIEFINQLEILHWGLVHTAVEIQHEGLHLYKIQNIIILHSFHLGGLLKKNTRLSFFPCLTCDDIKLSPYKS